MTVTLLSKQKSRGNVRLCFAVSVPALKTWNDDTGDGGRVLKLDYTTATAALFDPQSSIGYIFFSDYREDRTSGTALYFSFPQ